MLHNPCIRNILSLLFQLGNIEMFLAFDAPWVLLFTLLPVQQFLKFMTTLQSIYLLSYWVNLSTYGYVTYSEIALPPDKKMIKICYCLSATSFTKYRGFK